MAMSVSDPPAAPPSSAEAEPAIEPIEPGDPPHLSHRSSIIAGLAALVVLLFLLVTAAFALKSDGTPHPKRVLFVGDSITDQARSVLPTSFPSDDTVDVQAVPGRKFAEMLPFALQAAASKPDEVVINLGSNDVLLGETPAVTEPAMASMFDAFANTPCVTLVTVNQHFIFGSDQGARARRINDELRGAAAAHGWSVVDWNQMVEDHIAAGNPGGPITTDSVHPSEAGQRLLIDAERASLDRCEAARSSKNP
jgi:hypothetical protein